MPSWAAMALLLLAVAVVLCYLIAFKLPPMTFYSGDCGTKLLQVQSLVMQRWKSAAVVYPGRSIDPQLEFVGTGMLQVRKGQVWGVHSLVFAVLASLPYHWLGYRGLYVVPALSLLGALLLLLLLAKRIYGLWRALLVTGVAAFCTPLLFYGVEFWEHTLAVFLAMAAVLFMSSAAGASTPPLHFTAAGAFLAAALTVRPEVAILVVAALVGLAAAVGPGRRLARSVASLMLGGAAVLVPALLANQRLFGDPLGTVLGLHLRAGSPDPRLLIVEKLLAPITLAVLWKLVAAVLAGLLLWRLRLREARQRRGWVTIALALLPAGIMAAIAAAEGRRMSLLLREPTELTSLVDTFPIIWVLPLAAVLWRYDTKPASRPAIRFLALTTTAYSAGVLAISPTWAGAQWGPRLLLPALPLLALLAVGSGSLRLASGRVTVLAVCLLALVSLGIQVSGIKQLAQIKGGYVTALHSFARFTEPDAVVVSGRHWFQEILAPLYYQRRFFYLSSPDLTGEFLRALRESGVSHFYYHLPRDPDTASTPESITGDLVQQLARHNLLNQGLTLERCGVIGESPYYLLRFATGVTPDDG